MKRILMIAAVIMAPTMTHAQAGAKVTTNVQPTPVAGMAGHFWQHAGCVYTRAQAPGFRPTWHIVINPNAVGLPRNARGCPSIIGRP